jgi:inner membrane protein
MENLAHTLLGLSMAKAGLERATPLATATLIISSNLPDIDAVTRLGGSTLTYLDYHRGLTHSFFGVVVLAAVLMIVLTYLDRKFRLRRDHRRRPVRPLRIFLIACAGGLGHLLMDYTNSYGVRPLLPFSSRWFYGDLIFIVDPWIWLMLGAAAVWLTATNAARALMWAALGLAASLLVALALRGPVVLWPVAIPTAVRLIWFAGLAVIILGAALAWGRAGARLAQYSLLALGLYYGGMWIAHKTAIEQAKDSLPIETASLQTAWPSPANPLLWQPVAIGQQRIYTRYLNLLRPGVSVIDAAQGWHDLEMLDPKFLDALGQSSEAQRFLRFARFTKAAVEEREDGYKIELCDIRFNLCMEVTLDSELRPVSTHVGSF